MAAVSFRAFDKELRLGQDREEARPGSARPRVRRPGRTLGLRQVDDLAHAGRAGEHHRRRDPHRRPDHLVAARTDHRELRARLHRPAAADDDRADPRFFRHVAPAVLFDGPDDLAARIDDPALAVDPDSVLVLRNAGPVGDDGMGQPADPQAAAARTRARHGADLGRTDERHALRHVRAARGARSGCRRPTRPPADRRPRRSGRDRRPARHAGR